MKVRVHSALSVCAVGSVGVMVGVRHSFGVRCERRNWSWPDDYERFMQNTYKSCTHARKIILTTAEGGQASSTAASSSVASCVYRSRIPETAQMVLFH
jgi:hypothetical protein